MTTTITTTNKQHRAVILAGGRGTRLAPYTTVLPKPLMPIGDCAILEVVLRQLAYYNFSTATIALGYLDELMMAYLGDGRRTGINITYSREEKPLGTAGPLKLINDLDETFLVMNGDILTTLDYEALLEYHRRRNATATIAVFPRPVHIDFGVIAMDGSRCLTDYIEKPNLNYEVSMGVYVFEPRVLEYIPEGQYFDFPTLVKALLKAGELVVGYTHKGYWLDLGRKEDYERAIVDFADKRAEFLPVKASLEPILDLTSAPVVPMTNGERIIAH